MEIVGSRGRNTHHLFSDYDIVVQLAAFNHTKWEKRELLWKSIFQRILGFYYAIFSQDQRFSNLKMTNKALKLRFKHEDAVIDADCLFFPGTDTESAEIVHEHGVEFEGLVDLQQVR